MKTSVPCERVLHPRVLVLAAVLLLVGCGEGAGTTAPAGPTAIPSPAATPTPTPIPPVLLTIEWPGAASALDDFLLQVHLPDLAERDPEAQVSARLTDPLGQVWWEFDMAPAADGRYASETDLHLPLDPPPGDWRLTVFLYADVPVNGARTVFLQPGPVSLRDLGAQIPEGVTLHIPRAFTSIRHEGDQVSGARVWSRGSDEVGLWWLPGPTEPLAPDTALVMVEATFPEDGGVEVLSVEPAEWGGLTGYRYEERWPEGLAETLVLQGPYLWLYLLRVRTLAGPDISPLLWDIQASFSVQE